MYSIKNIYNICSILHNIFDNKIVCCGGLADFFHLNTNIKDFDFYITISNLINIFQLPNNITTNLLDEKKEFTIKLKNLKFQKYASFLPDQIACLQNSIEIEKIIYYIDLFIIKDTDYKPYKIYKFDNYLFNIQTPESRINTLKYHLFLINNNYKSNRRGANEWFIDKKNKFDLRIKEYKNYNL